MQIIKQQQHRHYDSQLFKDKEEQNNNNAFNRYLFETHNYDSKYKKENPIPLGPLDDFSETQKRVFPKRYLYANEKMYSTTCNDSYIGPMMRKMKSPSMSRATPKEQCILPPLTSPRVSQRKSRMI